MYVFENFSTFSFFEKNILFPWQTFSALLDIFALMVNGGKHSPL
jgi:hypothetical protein